MTMRSIPKQRCFHCNGLLDGWEDPQPGRGEAPGPGCVSMCLYCRTVAVYGDDMKLRAPTDAELTEMAKTTALRDTTALLAAFHAQLKRDGKWEKYCQHGDVDMEKLP